MHVAKYIVLYILCFHFFTDACAQNKNKEPAGFKPIFDDLPIDDPAKNSVLQPGEDSIQKIKKNIFVTGTISRKRCFLGEPILLTYTLYSSLQSTSKIDIAPSLTGFSAEVMEADNEKPVVKKQNGKNYRAFTIQMVQLTPLQEGALIIDPVSVYNEVSYKENEKTMHYGGSVQNAAIMINVDPLPVAGRPADFNGAAGNFMLQVFADTVCTAKENDTLHIEISGTGNFTAVSLPEIIWPAGCEHFSVNSRLEINKNSFPSPGKKVFDIPFVPAKEEILIIPAIQLSFFNTQKKIYQSARSNPVTVHVSPGLNKPAPGGKEPVKKQTPYYYLLAAVMVVVAAIIIFLYRRKRKPEIAIEKAKMPVLTAAPVKIKKEIIGKEQLQALNAAGDKGEYIAMFKKMLGDCLWQNTDILPVTEESLLRQLQIKDVELATAAGHLFAQCNSLLYAPGFIDPAAKTEMENKLVDISVKANQIFV